MGFERLWLGLFIFVIGLVLIINLNSYYSVLYGYNSFVVIISQLLTLLFTCGACIFIYKQLGVKKISIMQIVLLLIVIIFSLILLYFSVLFLPITTCLDYITTLLSGIIYEVIAGLVILGGIILFLKKLSKDKELQTAKIFIVISLQFVLILYLLGASSGAGGFQTSCVAQANYSCVSPGFYANTGLLCVIIGESTGTNWISTNIIFLPAGVQYNGLFPSVAFNSANQITIAGGLKNQQRILVHLPAANTIFTVYHGQNAQTIPLQVGWSASGTLWAQYQITNGTPFKYAQIATATLKAE